MLHVHDVSKTFNGLHVLKSVSFSIRQGDFVVIMGPSGTGKSTLFDIISGKTAPDQGMITLDGTDITFMPEQRRAVFLGRLFQNTYLGSCATLTIRENLAMAMLKQRRASLQLGIRSFPEETVMNFLKPLQLNLEKLLDVPMGALSGGQRQIISFIMSILTPPKLLLLDEPTAALDPNSAFSLLTFVKKYVETHKIPTMLISHDPMISKHFGNQEWILENGSFKMSA